MLPIAATNPFLCAIDDPGSALPPAGGAGVGDEFRWPNPAGTRVAAILSTGAGDRPAQVGDTLTGLGRANGYDSLANARRAAYMLTRGTTQPAAGVYQQGDRFYVRSMGEFTAHDGAFLAVNFEGAADGVSLLAVQDPRLLLLVDGSTKLFRPTA